MSELNPQPAAAPEPESPAPPAPTAPVRHNSTELDTFFESQPTPDPAHPSPQPPAATPLTPRQHTAISLLTSGETISSAAAILGVHRATLHNWKRDPAFAAELARRQHEVNHAADARLRLLMLQSTHHALQSLHAEDEQDRWRNAFRLLSILRPYRAALNTPDPAHEPPAPPAAPPPASRLHVSPPPTAPTPPSADQHLQSPHP